MYLKDASTYEKQLQTGESTRYNQLNSLVDAGPGTSDVMAGTQASRSLADMLAQYSKTGGLPGAEDYNTGRSIAAQQFDPQRTALDQQFTQDTTAANRQAALMGRSINDPILRNKLLQNKNNQLAMLNSQQNAAATNFALSQPMQRLGFASQLADVRGNLASQAMSNRQTLLSLGNTLKQQERDFRLNTSTRFGVGNSSSQSGGGLLGGLGALASVTGSMMSLAGGMGGMGGMGGAAGGLGGGAMTAKAMPQAMPSIGSSYSYAQPAQVAPPPPPISPFLQPNSSYGGPGYGSGAQSYIQPSPGGFLAGGYR